ncbi:MAG: hypothetical protein LUF89_04360 [Ruminococcus sp.]|nr:hypothetical protein [Ruminococcus sp.]
MKCRINNPSLITQWVSSLRTGGLDALKPKKKGHKALNSKIDKKEGSSSEKVDTSAERLKELEDENLRMRIENTFLKELKRQRLERETLRETQRKSSTVSEDNSD